MALYITLINVRFAQLLSNSQAYLYESIDLENTYLRSDLLMFFHTFSHSAQLLLVLSYVQLVACCAVVWCSLVKPSQVSSQTLPLLASSVVIILRQHLQKKGFQCILQGHFFLSVSCFEVHKYLLTTLIRIGKLEITAFQLISLYPVPKKYVNYFALTIAVFLLAACVHMTMAMIGKLNLSLS